MPELEKALAEAENAAATMHEAWNVVEERWGWYNQFPETNRNYKQALLDVLEDLNREAVSLEREAKELREELKQDAHSKP